MPAYHDMAKLFGLKNAPTSFPYHAALTVRNDHGAC